MGIVMVPGVLAGVSGANLTELLKKKAAELAAREAELAAEWATLPPEEKQKRQAEHAASQAATREAEAAVRDARFERKQAGKCPFCEGSVEALIIEVNTFRRDKCRCPTCRATIYVCRTPGCHDYAKGTTSYDHELCPDCTSATASGAKEVGKAAVGIAVLVAKEVITQKVKGGDKGGRKGKR